MASGIYRLAKQQAWLGNIDLEDNTIRALLVDNTYTFDYDLHEYVDDISADELSSYTRVTLASVAVTEVAGGNTVKVDATDPTFASVGTGQTAHGMIIYKQVGGDDTTPEDDLLLFWVEFESDVSTNGNNIEVTLPATGIGVVT